MSVAEEGEGRAERLSLPVAGDSVGTFRVLVFGQPAHLADGSQDITFTLRNTRTGEQTLYRSVFMGPGSATGH
jgi:hypothetical protein